MKRRCFERTKRTATPRLIVEVLETRRVMAGLNVLVFQDQDGSRSQSAVDTPAANRLVYVDLNRDGKFADGEPLAVSNADGIASFTDLPAGEYRIALAGKHAAQLQTTSVSSVPVANSLVSYASQYLLANRSLSHAWAISPSGQVRAVGASDPDNLALDLGGPVISVTQVVGDQAWALIDQGQSQPRLLRLDLSEGKLLTYSVNGMLAGRKLASVAWLGDGIVLQQQSASGSWLSRTKVSGDAVLMQDTFSVPTGRVIDSGDAGRIAILDPHVDGGLSMVAFRGSVAEIASVPGMRRWRDAVLSPDGKILFAAAQAGGVEVFSTHSGLKSVAMLAEATGPMAISPRDGRLTTANATVNDQLIVWDTMLWQPVSRTTLAGQSGPVVAVSVDEWGNRLLAATQTSLFTADLAMPSAMVVQLPLRESAKASLGVRVTSAADSLPRTFSAAQTVIEDEPLELNLPELAALSWLSSSSLMFVPSAGTSLGTLQVTPSGRFTYHPAADQHGSDKATIQVYDGISSSTLIVSLAIQPVNDPPTDFMLQSIAIAEAAEAGALAGTVSVLDVDTDARYLITTSDQRFVVVDGQLLRSASGSLDYESEPVVELELTATDMEDAAISWTRQFQIPILDSNDGPISISLIPVPVTENTAGSLVGNVVVVDPDGYDHYVFSVSDDRFEVVGGQLRLKPGMALDRESEKFVSLSLRVYDAAAQISSEAKLTTSLEILDANDPPEAIVLERLEVPLGITGAVVGVMDVIDQDILDLYSFAVSDSRFEMDGNVLRLRADQKLMPADGSAIPILVTAQDPNGVTITQSFTVNVVNDVPGQNPVNPLDVDNDGHVSPRDALVLINVLNDKGPHAIEPLASVGEGDGIGPSVFIDVNGDGMLTALDVLLLINQLNNPGGMRAAPEGESAPLVVSKAEPLGLLPNQSAMDTMVNWQAWADPAWAGRGDGMPSSLVGHPNSGDIFALADSSVIDAEIESLLESLSREGLR